MYTRPEDLTDRAVTGALAAGWGLTPVAVDYQAVGYGSYHWQAHTSAGESWFVTVDDLMERQRSAGDSPEAVHRRLRAALLTALAARRAGADFVVAPVPTLAGDVLARLGGRHVVALYPFVAGRRFDFGDTLPATGRDAVLRHLVALHSAPRHVSRDALTEEFSLPHRAELSRALADASARWDTGPYGEPARALLATYGGAVEKLLAQYDRLVAQAREQPERRVLTHGEPHPGNLIETGAGWMLVDWDTTLLALPERDLWLLDPGDGSVAGAYRRAAGREALPAMLALYRLTWELTDIADFMSQFSRQHGDTEDDRVAWRAVRGYLPGAAARDEEISRILRV
jgi:spectinomycin phosphotransferase/16S rRNA (guanine(1405)-N(7))-methyltransferase